VKTIGNIYLAWRKGKGHRRYLVGILKRNATEGTRFYYFKEEVEKAKKEGFVAYTDFPDINKVYKRDVLRIFSQRLMKKERTDISSFYNFWEIDPKYADDNYYILAHTQGLLLTDNFEFLADFNPVKGLNFVSEIAGLSKQNIKKGIIENGDILNFQKEPTNEYDRNALKVYKDDFFLGYIKKVHNKVFYKKNGEKLKLEVKGIDHNGKINRIFIKIFL